MTAEPDLPGLLAALAAADPARPAEEQDAAFARFMDGLFDVELTRLRSPAYAARHDVVVFRREVPPLLPIALGALAEYTRETRRMLSGTWYDDEDRVVCRRRSAVEFLRRLAPGVVPAPERLDERLRERWSATGGFFHAPQDRPEGVPETHWWWYTA
ncbi:hypothetical protein Afil01_40620 [Actinorhabdospora filicis]|uniref:Uncharacterized protein n=1 Tax=Actinorhabdospora filicis TaxID=1785913 RepID=A0A9W6SLQ3_9ACTN|nr:hypothetical protein [Actinorhabdospora filicis]GLZ79255.1 hypothetical protein Afil01_40620 [Actinorhabdospora filicis]